jgi:hypothetical protein
MAAANDNTDYSHDSDEKPKEPLLPNRANFSPTSQAWQAGSKLSCSILVP